MKKAFLYLVLSIVILTSSDIYSQTWVTVGASNILLDSCAGNISIAMGNSGTPYVVYADGYDYWGDPGPAAVIRYNGISWEYVGSPRFSAGDIDNPSIAIDRNGTPYVFYSNGVGTTLANEGPGTVMKFDGSNWVTVGDPNFTITDVFSTSIAIDTSGTPYVAYSNYDGPATVMKYNGGNWVVVGSPNFSVSGARPTQIAIDRSNIPYVAYCSDSGYAVVMKFDGSSWVNTSSTAALTYGQGDYLSMALDKSGTPYLAYSMDWGPASVIKYNGASWELVGPPGFSDSIANYTCITIDSSGTPYVYYQIEHPTYYESYSWLSPGWSIVLKYNGISWDTVGCANCLVGTQYSAYSASIVVDGSGMPYILSGNSVMRLDTSIKTSVRNIIKPTNFIGIYPNTVTNYLTITATDPITSITIFNLIGQTIFTNQYNTHQVQVDVADLPAGVYFVKVNGSDVRKFVKE